MSRKQTRLFADGPRLRATEDGASDGGVLSPNETSLWFLARLQPDSPQYNLAGALRFDRALDAGAMRRALEGLAIRHEALRTTFPDVDGVPRRVVHSDPVVALEVEYEIGDVGVRLSVESSKPFDLAAGPLWRVRLIQGPAGEGVLVAVLHHILFDFSSLAVFLQELGDLYTAEIEGEALDLPSLRMSLSVHAWLQASALERNGERLSQYWRSHLDGVPQQLAFVSDNSAGSGGAQQFAVSRRTADRIKILARENGTTAAVALGAVFQLLLHRWTGQDDLVLGFPFGGRNRPGAAKLIGYFVNMTAVRSRYCPDRTFEEFLRETREVIAGAHAHQGYPVSRLVEDLKVPRDSWRHPLIQATFVYQNASAEALPIVLGMPDRQVRFGAEYAATVSMTPAMPFDLSMVIGECARGLEGVLQYDGHVISDVTASSMVRAFDSLLEAIASNSRASIADLAMLRDEEKSAVLRLGARQASVESRDGLLGHRLTLLARCAPDGLAVKSGEREICFRELEDRANQLAHYLIRCGVGRGSRVGLLGTRCAETIIGLIGIWKAGAAYVPIAPSDPEERVRFVLEDAGARVMVRANGRPALLGVRIVTLDDEAVGLEPRTCPVVAEDGDDLAYVIYTSGSTGRPKGVMIPRRAVASFHQALKDAVYQELGGASLRVALNAPFSFDASVQQIVQLLGGHALVIVPDEARRDGEELAVFLSSNAIEVLDCTPVQLQTLLASERSKAALQNLKAVLVGGEAIPTGLWNSASQLHPVRFFNVYGPTECTVDATIQPIFPGTTPKIGLPLRNSSAYVLDDRLSPVPIGVCGELYIGGDGLATGYLNQPGLTAERFLPAPWSGHGGGRMYRTGDIVRWSAEGELEFVGRRDQQVKIRGYRIELGEIEEQLRALNGVDDAAVVMREDDTDKSLIAYVKPHSKFVVDVAVLRRSLRERMPDHMIPARWMVLDRMPQTSSGKLDRTRLPEPVDEPSRDSGRDPQTPTEQRMAKLWCELLKRTSAGADENFFELGGHSLLATQLLVRIRDSFGVTLQLRNVFENPRLADLAEVVDRTALQEARETGIVRRQRSGHARASYAQERMWVLWELAGGQSAAYHMSGALRLKGDLDVEALEWSINQVIRRHDALRTRFEMSGSELLQVVEPAWRLELPEEDFRGAPELEWREAAMEETGRSFDLRQLPMLRSRLFRIAEHEWVLLVAMHHIAGDGWSFGVIEEEINEFYNARRERREAQLGELAIQYADYAESQRDRVESGSLNEQLTWWRQRLSEPYESLNLPGKNPTPRGDRAAEIRVDFGAEFSTRLETVARSLGATLHMILSASLGVVLSRYTGRSEIRLGIPVAGRSHRETETLVGFFVNTIIVPVRISGRGSFACVVADVKRELLACYERQDVPLQKLMEEARVGSADAGLPFSVLLALGNTPRPGLHMSGVDVEPYPIPSLRAKAEIAVLLEDERAGVHGVVEYRADEYDHDSMDRLVRHWRHWLEAAVANPERSIAELPLMDASELDWINERASGGERTWTEVSLVGRFERQTLLTPDAIAVEGHREPWRLTYSELNARANQLARWLQRKGIEREDRVGLFLRRGPAMIAAVIGTLKAGAAYVPLDERYPIERIHAILRDSGSRLLLSEAGFSEPLSAIGIAVAHLDELDGEIARESVENLRETPEPDNLAYVLYTSGSTGQPKGVMLTHRGAVNLVGWALEAYTREELSSVAFSTSLGFDLSVYEIWTPLSCGGRMIVVDNATAIAGERFHLLNTVPSAMRELLRMNVLPADVGVVNLAGEALHGDQVSEIYAATNASRVANLYGPTETTTYSTAFDADRSVTGGNVPIGLPLTNTGVYVLDACGELAPIGVEGELYIGGAGVARGYQRRPDLTAERFVPCKFSGHEGERVYRTGDRVRWCVDGNLEYLGRIDQQVKIRGFRIELGEIEIALRALPGIKDAVVVAHEAEGRDKRLVAYVVMEPGRRGDLRRELSQRLPDYMVPA
ncbi:MAG: amino acid adenylation domain-containing protein, partial [Bryobacteraceae bacterium]